ncbi:MliC family protein [Bradyrhizobium lablabi]|uniref:MliC family protein n=1 Tax=Bradyrhizobium lablabi TaxID=722472 RepID=UPI001BAA524A|nr:MliC family protein [Bradyrhizobium lablabi]MBR0692896.1 MliC family protein [Bradyrhizobium lablabi]
MHYRQITILVGTALSVAFGASAASAQTFQNYRCADGTQFIAAFYQYDARAHLQLDGKAVTLKKRFSLSGSRYSGNGVTLIITKAGLTSLKHARRAATACSST